jgi:hypothetical protein
MLSHTIPKRLLENFAYRDPRTQSLRLWRYQKGRAPYGRAAPKSATRWEHHFADPANEAKEKQIEFRLKQEFEDPVNEFLEQLLRERDAFTFTPERRQLLSGYVTMLFHRSRARREASVVQNDKMVAALRAVRDDQQLVNNLIAKYTLDQYAIGQERLVVTKKVVLAVINDQLRIHSLPDAPQLRYIETLETLMGFDDVVTREGEWRVLSMSPDRPFVIGDAPVVTWIRERTGALTRGFGFARADVEVVLPLSSTVCLHLLPRVQRTSTVLTPSVDEVNLAQAALSTEHCFTNIESNELNALLQPEFGTVRLGKEGFNIDHIDSKAKLYEVLMNQPLPALPKT